ncbi:MAG TPA: molybdopterin molybdotransferase MoeA [Candidatus Latescibacteria bacterium]|nr:molybdopterin molybdotransferase MoeA [Candidatus Latescibacterota bacterium]
MPSEFLQTVTREKAQIMIREAVRYPMPPETVELDRAPGRILAVDITAPEDYPAFPRSTMDGYAVVASDTFRATETKPVKLKVMGEVPMGKLPQKRLTPGRAVRISTGGALPEGANAVLMLEYTEEKTSGELLVSRPVPPGANVIAQGGDMKEGEEILKEGTRLRAQHLGVLAGLGMTMLQVRRKPVVSIIATGDELVPAGKVPSHGQIRDVNSHTLAAQIIQTGGQPCFLGLAPDDAQILRERLEEGIDRSELVVISGGSSIGARDITLEAIRDLGGRTLIHGVAVKPGKPTIVAELDGKLLFGLPGHPMSSFVSFILFVRTALLELLAATDFQLEIEAALAEDVYSRSGREEWIPARLEQKDDGLLAIPLVTPSARLYPLAMAVGLIRVAQNMEGMTKGEKVRVVLI